MNFPIFIFIIGLMGFIINRKSLIMMIISIEIMLMAITLMILMSCFIFEDSIGMIFSITIITLAGAESAIGLGILVSYFSLRGNIQIDN